MNFIHLLVCIALMTSFSGTRGGDMFPQ